VASLVIVVSAVLVLSCRHTHTGATKRFTPMNENHGKYYNCCVRFLDYKQFGNILYQLNCTFADGFVV